MDEDSNYSPSHKTKVKQKVLVGGGEWIKGDNQDKIFRSINFHALKHVVESDMITMITKAIGNWRLKVDQ
jgi:hypothetical protein